jgi:glycosyltransferase involved in cell wall biosynthesis
MESIGISVICCVHNEEKYVDTSIPTILKALDDLPHEVIFVADRCTDKTIEKARHYEVFIFEKHYKKWINSYAESLQLGYLNASGNYLAIVDADIIVTPNLFKKLISMLNGNIVSASPIVETYPDSLLNRLKYAWEKTHAIAPFGRAPYGAARVFLKKALDEINGFRDVPTPDTDLDIRLCRKGYQSMIASVKVYHIRHASIRNSIIGQINRGKGRYDLNTGFIKTVGHAFFRLRPFVVCGWLMEKFKKREVVVCEN